MASKLDKIRKKIMTNLKRRLIDVMISCYGCSHKSAYKVALNLVSQKGAVKDFVDSFINILIKQREELYVKEQKLFLINSIGSFTILAEFVSSFEKSLVSQKLLEIPLNNILENFTNNFCEKDIKSFFITFNSEYFASEDSRQQIEDRPIRRLDSLARICSLSNALSVCSAVAFHDGELIVSANVSKQGSQQEIKEILVERAISLQQLIIELNSLYMHHDIDFEYKLTNMSKIFVNDIFEGGCTSMPRSRIQEDVEKFITAIIGNDNIFTSSEKQNWLSKNLRYKIILPNKLSSREFDIQSSGSLLDLSFALPKAKAVQPQVKNYHAEQLLAYYVFKLKHDYNIDSPFKIGVSKLCCRACEAVFISKAIKTRGGHGNSYSDVENVFAHNKKIKFKTPDHKSRPTNAFNSPKGTHLEKLRRSKALFSVVPSKRVRRRLFQPLEKTNLKDYTKYFGENPQIELGGLFADYLKQRADDY